MPRLAHFLAAITEANKSTEEYRVGAVLYNGNTIISRAFNEYKPLGYATKYFEHGEPTRHAELGCMHNISREVLRGCTILVVRLSAKGELVSAKPCKACMRAMQEKEIKKVYFTTYTGQLSVLTPSRVDLTTYEKERKNGH